MKKYLLAAIFLILALLVGLSGLSSETREKNPMRSMTMDSFSQFRFKSSLKSREHFQQSRPSSDSSDIRWVCSYGTNQNDYLFTIKQAKDGGYFAAGKSYGMNGIPDAVLIKINEEGSLEWQKSYGMVKEEAYYPCSVAETSDGGYILATDSVNTGSSKAEDVDILVLKLSSDGSILWQKTYGRETSAEYTRGEILQTRDGGFILVGAIVPLETTTPSILILKLDSAGNILWDKIFKTPGMQWGDSVQQTSDGGYIVGGEVLGYPSIRSAEKAHPLILKLDPNGNVMWQKLYEGHGKVSIYRVNIIVTRDNGYLVADSVEDATRYQWGLKYNGDFWVFKLDPSGNILWQNLYGGSQWDQPYALCETRDGQYAVGGYTESYGEGSSGGWILKLGSAGNIVWQKAYCEKSYGNLLFSISQKSSGDFLAAGYTVRGATESDMLALNISEDGEIGEGGNWVMDTDAIAAPTFAVAINADLAYMNAGLISNLGNASSADYSLTREILCWNLHQPPISVSLKTEINRSLFRKELKNTLIWQPNPFNDQFSIVEYRIYRKVGNNDYEMIKAVSVDVTEYVDELIPATGQSVSYSLTSVDSKGIESPRSLSVWH
jgi:hypothetical protein